jgi:hypothetical protein
MLSVSCELVLKFGTCTVVSVNGTLVEAKMSTFTLEFTHLSSTSVPFTLTTLQVLNFALTHSKRITVQSLSSSSLREKLVCNNTLSNTEAVEKEMQKNGTKLCFI